MRRLPRGGWAFVCGLIFLWMATNASGADGTGTSYIPNHIDDSTVYPVSLPYLDGSGYLRGDYVDVTNSQIPRAYSAGLSFAYSPSVPGNDRIHFAETMTYYQITAYQDYVKGLGIGNVGQPISAVVYASEKHGPVWLPIDSSYDPATHTLYLANFSGNASSDALDGFVTIHEYTHALQNQLMGGRVFSDETSATQQGRAILESAADYAATSRFNSPRYGTYFAHETENAHLLRNVDNFYRWPQNLVATNPYSTGMIWSGALWDLRSVVGASVADTLALKTFSLIQDNNPSTPEINATFSEALAVLLQADTNLYGGAHQDKIRQAFAVHGIGTYDFSTLFPMVRDPGNNYDGLQTFHLPGAKALQVTFDEFVTKLDDSPYTTDQAPQIGTDEKTTADWLTILDGEGNIIGAFTGRQLQGATLTVPGDTVKFHLTTDAYLDPFGYRVLDIQAVPEPATLALLSAGLLLGKIGLRRRARQRAAAPFASRRR